MAFIQVVGMFDNPASLQRARSAVVGAGLATDADIRVEPEVTSEQPHSPASLSDIWRRLKKLVKGESDEQIGIYAEGVRRGSLLLVVTVDEKNAENVKQIMRENGAVELRRRVRRWLAEGWTGFDPAGLGFIEEEITDERKCIDAESEAAGEEHNNQPRNIQLFDEGTGQAIGRISEDELKVLQDALEEEAPDDNDYWINPDVIEELSCRPGATPHLIRLLRAAVSDKPDGIDIAFERDGQGRQAFSALRQTGGKGNS